MQPSKTNCVPEPAIGVGGIVFNNQNQVLLIKRNQAPAKGLWSIPGGKLEAGESMVTACSREIKEETGLDTEIRQIVAVVERRIENFHYVIIDFLARLQDQDRATPIAQSDVADTKWIDIDKIATYPLVEGLADIIQRSHRLNGLHFTGGLLDINCRSTDFVISE